MAPMTTDAVSSRNAVTWVGRSVRYRCITAIAAIPAAVITPVITTTIHHGRRRRIASHMPAAAKSVIAAPKFDTGPRRAGHERAGGEEEAPPAHADAMREEHRGSEHDADLDVRHPEEAPTVQLSAAGQRRHGRRPTKRGLDGEDRRGSRHRTAATATKIPRRASTHLRERDARDHDDHERGTEPRSRAVRDGRWPTSRRPSASHGKCRRERLRPRASVRAESRAAERQSDDRRETEEHHHTPAGGGGRHGEPALLEVALVEIEGRRLAGALDRRAGVVREVEPLGDGRRGIHVGDDAGAPGGVGGERVRLDRCASSSSSGSPQAAITVPSSSPSAADAADGDVETIIDESVGSTDGGSSARSSDAAEEPPCRESDVNRHRLSRTAGVILAVTHRVNSSTTSDAAIHQRRASGGAAHRRAPGPRAGLWQRRTLEHRPR